MLPTTDSLDQFAHPGVPEISVQEPDDLIFKALGPAAVMLHLMARSVSQSCARGRMLAENFLAVRTGNSE